MSESVYDRIDAILKQRRISRRKLAEMAGINVNTMSAIFARKAEPLADKYLDPIAEALEVPKTELLGIRVIHPEEQARLSLFASPQSLDSGRLSANLLNVSLKRKQELSAVFNSARSALDEIMERLPKLSQNELKALTAYLEKTIGEKEE